jgi:integrase
MITDLTTTTPASIVPAYSLAEAGQAANDIASQNVFVEYRQRKSTNSLSAQRHDLVTFCEYLHNAGIQCDGAESLQTIPAAWQGVTWGLVAGFVRWMLREGLAVSSINRKLSTVKVYAGLATQAGVISGDELAKIRTVKGFAGKEFKNTDDKRREAGQATRTGTKKAESTKLDAAQAKRLKQQPDTPQGRRDAVIMALLIDHGLRVGELAALQVTDINLAEGLLRFYRPKVSKTQTHELTKDAKRALRAYMPDAPAMGPLLRASLKSGALAGPGMTRGNITRRVGELGEAIGLAGLSSHDLRHYWATRAIRKGSDPFAVLQAGGWTSMATVQKYVDETAIANKGIKGSDGDED